MNQQNANGSPAKMLTRIMLQAELPASLACMAGLLLKLFRIPAANLMLVLSMGVLILLYYLTSIGLSADAVITNRDKTVCRLNGIGCSMGAMAILFQLMHWPGSLVMVVTGLPVLMTMLGYMSYVNTRNVEIKVFEPRRIYRTAGITALVVLVFLA